MVIDYKSILLIFIYTVELEYFLIYIYRRLLKNYGV